ncbi:hypothetical protein CAI21_09745 [Alkalilimnicola ehrlichii]|uniref:Right handed beta helix domain-containing protein n=2 Tax=Alkalilimnicola ehrlichii TaxID=351052 RepID=A0A3E0WY78_9GAMM|nr:hypothetical protein CAI21_09745 [Alkalilimnicola ehrlichii]RFA36857.1 hypothetical protein CAL65_10080 [Alkalilimnicola ehrlichii]
MRRLVVLIVIAIGGMLTACDLSDDADAPYTRWHPEVEGLTPIPGHQLEFPPELPEWVEIAGTRYYVDYDGGSDANDGTSPESAWKHSPRDPNATGKPAEVRLKPGDGVIFKGGVVYRGSIAIRDSGTASAPVVFDGTGREFGQGSAIIDGSEFLTGWQCSGEICHTILPDKLPEEWQGDVFALNLYTENRRMTLAQGPEPASDYFVPYQLEDLVAVEGHQFDTTWVEDFDVLSEIFGEGNIGRAHVVIWANDNRIVLAPIESYDARRGRIVFEDNRARYFPNNSRTYYAIVNHQNVLSQPGEFVYDPETREVWVIPFPNTDVNTITYSLRPVGIDVQADHVVVQGFIAQKFVGARHQWHDGVGIRVYANGPLKVSERRGVLVQGNEVRFNSSRESYGAIYTRATRDLRILNNYVHHNFPNRGIQATEGFGTEISGNHVSGGGHTGITFFRTENSIIAYNTVDAVTAVHANGISNYLSSHGNLILGNRVENGNIALTTKHSRNVTIAHNILTTHDANEGVNFAVADWGDKDEDGRYPRNLRYYNNIILNYGGGQGLRVHDDSILGLEVKNNILSCLSASGGRFAYNKYISTWCNQHDLDKGSGEERAELRDLFRNPEAGDYRPRAAEVLRPAAQLFVPYQYDIDGERLGEPTIGPYTDR